MTNLVFSKVNGIQKWGGQGDLPLALDDSTLFTSKYHRQG